MRNIVTDLCDILHMKTDVKSQFTENPTFSPGPDQSLLHSLAKNGPIKDSMGQFKVHVT